MRTLSLPSALLLALAACLYVLPPRLFDHWRLSLHSLSLGVREAVGLEPAPPVPDTRDREELEVLRKELQEKTATIARLRRQLAQVTEVRRTYPTLRFRMANVLALHGEQTPHAAVLDVGHRDNIRQYTGVLQGDALLGSVTLVGVRTSLMTFVTSPESVIAGRNSQTGELCSVRGRGDGTAVAVFYGIRLKTAVGDRIQTSGLLGSLPAGLDIGTLAEPPREGRDPGALEARVSLHGDIQALESVLLVDQEEVSSLPVEK